MRLFFPIVFFALLIAASSAYSDQYFTATAKIDETGNAHVIETSAFTLDTQAELAAFQYQQTQNQQKLTDWIKFSKNIHYHFNSLDASSVKIIPTKDLTKGSKFAILSLEYDANNIFTLAKKNTRTTEYSLDANRLAFSASSTSRGEITLGNNMKFVMELPSDAINIKTVPSAGVEVKNNVLTWSGPITSTWDISFEREKSLSSEVNEFFIQAAQDLTQSFSIILLTAFAIIAAYFVIIRSKK